MASTTVPKWTSRRTDETRRIEDQLRCDFDQVDAYRFNSASIRLRIVDPSFERLTESQREDRVFAELDKLPAASREDILFLLLLAPSELGPGNRHSASNAEFENPDRA